jgi:hypothetical protein
LAREYKYAQNDHPHLQIRDHMADITKLAHELIIDLRGKRTAAKAKRCTGSERSDYLFHICMASCSPTRPVPDDRNDHVQGVLRHLKTAIDAIDYLATRCAAFA